MKNKISTTFTSTPSPSRSQHPSQKQIADRAYQLWLQQGRPENRDLEHWLEAERQLGRSPASALHDEAFRLTADPLDPAASTAAEEDDELNRMVGQPARRSATSLT